LTLILPGSAGIPPTAKAVFLNVTATEMVAPGFVQVYPTGQAAPGSSFNLNITRADQTIPNAVFATMNPASGQVSLLTLGSTHLIADVAGYFTS
jgi:hypothetical protein